MQSRIIAVVGLGRIVAVGLGLSLSAMGSPAALGQACGEWTEIAVEGPSPRFDHSMVFDSIRQVVVLFGGQISGNQDVNDTWEWNGDSWTMVAQSGPARKVGHAMAFDSERGVTVHLTNYVQTNQISETWEWDGATWVQRDVAPPTKRGFHAMAYDTARGVTVVFGGEDGTLLDDTWEWDGTTWSLKAQDGPPPRFGHALAYDSNREVIVLFGGNGDAGQLDDTWEWDGVEWTDVSIEGPRYRRDHSMTFDSTRGATILYGGLSNYLDDTWEWVGGAWYQVSESVPEGRRDHAMVSNPANGINILFGGYNNDHGHLGDTWQWRYSFWFLAHPQDQVAVSGEPTSFQVALGGPDTPLYQWRRNSVPLQDGGTISGATTDTLSISRVFRADEGAYDCIVTSDCGSLTSQGATLDVVDPSLTVAATCPDGGPITISWQYGYPDGQVALIFARSDGQFTIPNGYPCAGTTLDLGASLIRIAWQGAAGSGGNRSINGSAGPAACGGAMQLLDLSTCTTGNVVRVE